MLEKISPRNKRQLTEGIEDDIPVAEKIKDNLLRVIKSGNEYWGQYEDGLISGDEFGTSMERLRTLFIRDAYNALRGHEFEELIEGARRVLTAVGVSGAERISAQTPTAALVITEAVNLAAKEVDAGFYFIKPSLIVASWKMGCAFGEGKDTAGYQVYYLGDPIAGVASFHDPDGEVEHIIRTILHEEVPVWEYKWSGIIRQDQAFQILEKIANGDPIANDVLEETLPDAEIGAREHYMHDPASALAKLSDVFKVANLNI